MIHKLWTRLCMFVVHEEPAVSVAVTMSAAAVLDQVLAGTLSLSAVLPALAGLIIRQLVTPAA